MGKKKKETAAPDIDAPPARKPLTTKQLVAGPSWTGKLPTALLNEYCQKQGWLKPDYSLTHRSGSYVITSLGLSKKCPKSSTIESVVLRPTEDELAILPPMALSAESRNFAATWGLHRVAHNLNFSVQMPPAHRSVWQALEIVRKGSKIGQSFLYDIDPFKGKKQHAAQLQQWEKQAISKPGTKEHTFVPTPWKDVPLVVMSQSVRQSIEQVVRSITLHAPRPASANEVEPIVSQLVQSGFRLTHAREACEYSNTLQSALEFLLLFTPEDDLPQQFQPPDYLMTVSGFNHDSKSLQIEYSAKRVHFAGYELATCRAAIKQYNQEDAAFGILQSQLLGLYIQDSCPTEQSDWTDEIDSLKAIYNDSFVLNGTEISFPLPNHRDYKLHFRPPHSGPYPDHIPSLYISHTGKIPTYIKLGLIRELGQHAVKLRGEPMLYLLIEYLDDKIEQFLENPGKLLDLAGAVTGSPADRYRKLQSSRSHREPRSSRIYKDVNNSKMLQAAKKKLQNDPSHITKLNDRLKLPAKQKEAEILKLLESHQFLVISGETGSGKSTQVVQYILDSMIDRGDGASCNIVCTQPRRISAIGLAERVGFERSNIREVGYVIRGASNRTPETKIMFMTIGVLLRKLTTEGQHALKGISHILVDEVHERSIESDFLLIVLRELLKERLYLKLILMSATIEADLFCDYLQAKHLHIPGKTFPVDDIYLDDMSFLGELHGREKKNGVNYDVIASIVEHIDKDLGEETGGILIFLPGTYEITKVIETINSRGQFNTLPLHASLPPDQQRRVFQPSYRYRKVIASTNVAETSITIQDIVAVIDTGRVKQMTFDPLQDITRFEELWCSRAACKQRRGRAGRVQAGKCYKVFTRALEASQMSENTVPEILRIPLAHISLSALAMKKNIRPFLNQAVTVPDQAALGQALLTLQEVGAIDADENLTPLGSLLAIIPADLKVAKLLVLASVFGICEHAYIIAACLSTKSPFNSSKESAARRIVFASHDGDVLADARAYEAWSKVPTRDRRHWCLENEVSHTILIEIQAIVSQYRDAMRDCNLECVEASRNDEVMKAIIAAAMGSNVARIQKPRLKYDATIGGAVARDHESCAIKYYTTRHRVFLHPSSTLFHEHEYTQASFISFFSGVMTTKFFVRAVSTLGIYGFLFLCHLPSIDPHGRGLIVNGWRLSAWSKIAIYVKLFRGVIDDIMIRKLEGQEEQHTNEEMILNLMRRLISQHGS